MSLPFTAPRNSGPASSKNTSVACGEAECTFRNAYPRYSKTRMTRLINELRDVYKIEVRPKPTIKHLLPDVGWYSKVNGKIVKIISIDTRKQLIRSTDKDYHFKNIRKLYYRTETTVINPITKLFNSPTACIKRVAKTFNRYSFSNPNFNMVKPKTTILNKTSIPVNVPSISINTNPARKSFLDPIDAIERHKEQAVLAKSNVEEEAKECLENASPIHRQEIINLTNDLSRAKTLSTIHAISAELKKYKPKPKFSFFGLFIVFFLIPGCFCYCVPPPLASSSTSVHNVGYQLWPCNVNYTTNINCKHIDTAIQQLTDITNIKFIKNPQNHQLIFDNIDYGCWSYVGKISSKQIINIGYDCCYPDILLHEISHFLGRIHEHQRRDRDQYITIKHKYRNDPQYTKLNSPNIYQYDYRSIMHYNIGFNIKIPPNMHLTNLDIRTLYYMYQHCW